MYDLAMLSMNNILYAVILFVGAMISREYLVGILFTKKESIELSQPEISVKILKVEESKIPRYITLGGILANREFLKLKPERRGQIKFLNQAETCKNGEVIVELESSAEEANLTKFAGALKKAEDHLQRAKDRSKQAGVVASSEMVTYESDYQIALGDFKRAEAELAKMKITAPFPGKIGIYNFSVGSYVNENDVIATYASLGDDLTVDFIVSEFELPNIKAGKEVAVSSNAFGDTLLRKAVIEKIDPNADATYSIRVRARLIPEGDMSQFCPGSSVTISIPVDTDGPVANVDERAIEERSGTSFMYVCSKEGGSNKYMVTRATVEVKGRSNGRAIVNLVPGTAYCLPIRGKILDQRYVVDASLSDEEEETTQQETKEEQVDDSFDKIAQEAMEDSE